MGLVACTILGLHQLTRTGKRQKKGKIFETGKIFEVRQSLISKAKSQL